MSVSAVSAAAAAKAPSPGPAKGPDAVADVAKRVSPAAAKALTPGKRSASDAMSDVDDIPPMDLPTSTAPPLPQPSAAPPPPPPALPASMGKIGTPAFYHYTDFVDNNIKSDGQPNAKVRGLYSKKQNTFLSTPEFHGDIEAFRRGDYQLKSTGVISIKRQRVGGEGERNYIVHAAPNPDGVNRLIPHSGPGVTPLKGSEIKRHVDRMREKGITFGEQLIQSPPQGK